jgi:cytidylate kinase
MKLTISGTPGSGKSTVARLLAERLKYNYYDVGLIRREVARRHGLTLEQLNRIGEKEDWTDKEADAITTDIGKKQDDFIFVGRLAYHFIPDSVKIFLECDIEKGAERIQKDSHVSRSVEKYFDLKHAVKKLKERIESDALRYKKYYNLDPMDRSQYDLIIDTTDISIEQVMKKILDFVE